MQDQIKKGFVEPTAQTQSEMQRLLAGSHIPNMASLIDRTNDPMAAIDQLGTWLARSLVFGCQSKEQGIIIVLACREQSSFSLSH
jgi:hypothetical protein